MPRQIIIKDMEKEIEKTIKLNNVDHLYRKLILMVDGLAKIIASFNYGNKLPGRKLFVQLHSISSFSIEFASIVRELRRHRANLKKIEEESKE